MQHNVLTDGYRESLNVRILPIWMILNDVTRGLNMVDMVILEFYLIVGLMMLPLCDVAMSL